ncbi:MAG TPA: MarR family transcriptional regulator [Nocardioidaceae bacterium]|nr:MarR family transcriptional regulator [Nocardioidaceae bacterium]
MTGGGDPDALLRAVERIAMTLTETGIPRMPARVFAYILADDADRYTAAELAEGLRVSPAAISGAVRYLVTARMVFKEREPGLRADVYRVYDDDVWGRIMSARLPILEQWEDTLEAAIKEIGPQSRGGRRLLETKEFYAFMRADAENMLERWRKHREQVE